ncbi:MAG: ATP-dependent helicase [Chloroflexota bacterium]|nr:ATP-dependent helicase [Chloroflexota bacterium]
MTKPAFIPRLAQKEILSYAGGKMGVSAVPGSGKTHVLSALAAMLVDEAIDDGQEVLIVTLVNSAVGNFASRIATFLQQERGLLPRFGYRVRTLHGLAHDIVRERPGLVGLADDFQIVDERQTRQILEDVVLAWLHTHPDALLGFLTADLVGAQGPVPLLRRIRDRDWPELAIEIAAAFIKRAKDLQLAPEYLIGRLTDHPDDLPLAHMGAEIYLDYQRGLSYRGGVDFDDLIRLALRALELDAEFCARLRERWPYILEDEAQDSSQLQEEILRRLAGPDGNWVRVGDPNQAIYETFTTADPHFLRDFLKQPDVTPITMPDSGRSQPSIIALANYLVDWAVSEHPSEIARGAFRQQHIAPTLPGDPQPNPPDDPAAVRLIARKFTPDAEIKAVVESLARWLPEHPDSTVAVLVPRNKRGFELTRALKAAGIDYMELLRSTTSTRQVAGVLGNVLRALADPTSPKKLATAFRVWRRADRDDPELAESTAGLAKLLSRCPRVEDYLWPRLDRDWLADLVEAGLAPAQEDDRESAPPVRGQRAMPLREFRDLMRRWQEAVVLPIDQLILTLAQDLFREATDLALAHKLAVALRAASDDHPNWRLPELVEELATIARNQRRFLGFDEEDTGFDPDQHRGQVVVATMHKAKGLEWDRVYLMSVNNYDFPSALPHDDYIAEKWFVRERLNLTEETLAQLHALAGGEPGNYVEGEATVRARHDYTAERLRLLYVGITRARQELIITWNTGRPKNPAQPAVPLIALQTWWEEERMGGNQNDPL